MLHRRITALSLLAIPLLACGPQSSSQPASAANPSGSGLSGADRDRGKLVAENVMEMADRCGRRCRFKVNAESTTTLRLSPNGVAEASDEGALLERLRAATIRSVHLTEWERGWSGSWSEGNGRLQVKLEPRELACKRTSDAGDVDNPCSPLPLELRCRSITVGLSHPKGRTARAWSCRSKHPRRTHPLTQFPWVFGLHKSIVALDGGDSESPVRRYALRHEDKPER